MTDAKRPRGRPPKQRPEAKRPTNLPPPLAPDDIRGAHEVLAAFGMALMQFDDGRTRDAAGVRLVTGAENIAIAWRAVHGPQHALPPNPGFAHCIRRWLALGQAGTALALLHYAQREGWQDDDFGALERMCNNPGSQ